MQELWRAAAKFVVVKSIERGAKVEGACRRGSLRRRRSGGPRAAPGSAAPAKANGVPLSAAAALPRLRWSPCPRHYELDAAAWLRFGYAQPSSCWTSDRILLDSAPVARAD